MVVKKALSGQISKYSIDIWVVFPKRGVTSEFRMHKKGISIPGSWRARMGVGRQCQMSRENKVF